MNRFNQQRQSSTRTVAVSCWLLIVIGMGSVQAATSDEAVQGLLQRTLEQHPLTLSAHAEKQASQSDLRAAQLQLLPTMGLQSQIREKSQGSNSSVLSVEQPLWTFGTLTGRIRQAQHLSEAATFNTQAVKENVAVQFFDALGALMAAHQTHAAKLEHWQQHRRYQGIMQRRVDAQVAPGVDMDLLSTRMLNLDMEVQSAATAVELQINKLKQISGVELSSADAALLSQPPDLTRLKVWKEQHDVEAMAVRVDQMPAVQKTMSELDAAKNHVKAVNAQLWPTLSVRYESQIQGERLPGQAKDSYWIGLNYSPGAGLSNFATATAEAYRLASAVAKVDEVKRIEAENIQAEWIKFNSAINNADLIRSAMQSSRAVHESYERQFEAGKKSWLDLLNTMRETQAQELQWIQAVSTAVVAQYKLRLKAGEWIVQP